MRVEETKHAQETEEIFIVLPHIELYTCQIEGYTYPSSKTGQITEYTSKGGRFPTQEAIKAMPEGLLLRTSR